MQNKKLDKSLLPKPQHPLGWKKGQLKISTSTANRLLDEQVNIDQAPTRKNSQSNQNSHPFSNKNLQSITTPQSNPQYRQSYNNSNSQSQDSRGLYQQQSPSQYSLQQKQLLTFAAQQSNQRIMNFYNEGNGEILIKESSLRKNNFSRASQYYQSSQEKRSSQKRSQSKNKEHKIKVYRHILPQDQEFIAYSVVTKQSRSGMFLNEKLLVLNSSKRQLSYFSHLPKMLPFSSYAEIQKTFLSENRPKQTIDFDRVRRFMFVPGKGNLAGVVVSFVNQLGERKQWKLGMGNNAVMNEWIETVNEVVKKEHLSVVKSQVKYPPKPKKQPDNKSNNYETKFTKTLKQQVLPLIRQSRLTTSNKSALNNSLNNSNAKSTQNQSLSPKSREKQYLVDSSKFVNTKNYVIDLEDVKNQDIFYVPPPSLPQEFVFQQHKKTQKTPVSSVKKIDTPIKLPLLTKDEPSSNSRFSQQLQKKQKLINYEHQNRVSTFTTKQPQQSKQLKASYLYQSQAKKSQSELIPQPFGLSKKSSGQRSSQSMHKDLNIHIDSKISFQEYEMKEDISQEQKIMVKNEHKKYFSQAQNYVQKQKAPSISPVSHQPTQKNNKPTQPRKRGYTQLIIQTNKNNQKTISQNRYSHQHQIKNTNNQQQQIKNTNSHNQPTIIERNDHQQSNQRHSNKNQQKASITQASQIEDIIIGNNNNRLTDNNYILNFSPHSYSNNWFRLWLETQPMNKVQIYTAFVKACKSIVAKLIDSPQQFSNCYEMTQNNSHIIFSIENITFKLPFKLHLPQGLGEFITMMDFIKSQDFLAQVFKYRKEIQDQFENYQFILQQLQSEFNNSTLSMPIYLPMCCMVKYKGITVLCKPNIQSSNLKIHKIPRLQFKNYQNQLQYIEQSCHVSFKLANEQQSYPSFDLYQIYLSSFNKSIIFMDNLVKYLPLLKNPLQKSMQPNLQLNKMYIEQHIKTGVVVGKKDVVEIEGHIFDTVVKNVVSQLQIGNKDLLYSSDQLIFSKGLKQQHLGIVYRRLQQQKSLPNNNSQKLDINQSLILTEIILTEYTKACDIFFMKQFILQLTSSITTESNQNQFSSSNVSNNTKTIKNLVPFNYHNGLKTISFGQRFQSNVLEMLNYLLCKNTKVWSVLINVIEEKYGITTESMKNHFNNKNSNAIKEQINSLLKKVNTSHLVTNFLQKLNAQASVKSWSTNQGWENFSINEENLHIIPKPKINCLSLKLFNDDYSQLINQLTNKSSLPASQNDLYSRIFQALNISQETYQCESYLIKSPEYDLLSLGYDKQRSLIDLALSSYVVINSKSTQYMTKEKNIDIYKKLLIQSEGRKSSDISPQNFEICLNGLKWLIRQKSFSLAEVLIQQQLQSIDIWYTSKLLSIKCKLLDLAALFYHKKLGNKSNLAVQYSMKSLKLALENKYLFKLQQLAEKAFQSANIHFQCQDLQKSLQLYQLAQEIIYESERNKTLKQTNLSIQFLNIYLRKAEIKLATGKTTQSLYSCLECLKKCQQFQQIVLNGNQYQDNSMHQKLQEIQLNVFQVIFRCYEVTKNIEDMRRISKVCCSKFVEDKILIMRMRHKIQTKSLDDSVHSQMMTKLLKMSWVALINQTLQKKFSQKSQSFQQKPLIPLPQTIKSFCLSGAFSQQNNKLSSSKKAYKVLENLKQKLLALCNLYPRNRYDDETLTSFICQQIVQNSTRINKNKNVSRAEYELISGKGPRMQQLSSRMEYLINNSIKQHQYSDSVLYELFSEVLSELTVSDSKASQSPVRNNMQRFAASVSFSQQRKSRSRETKRPSQIDRQSYTRTSVKNPLQRFYRSSYQNQPYVLPFSTQQDQFQPELSISPKNPINYYYNNDFKAENYNVYSLKDQMDKKYMLVEAIFGLCGREFVLGLLDETIERQKIKYFKNQLDAQCKTSMFYD